MLRLLLPHSDVHAVDDDGSIALHTAAAWGELEHVQPLIDYGADLELRDLKGRTPLALAVNRLSLNNCKALLTAGASVDALDARICNTFVASGKPGSGKIGLLLQKYGAKRIHSIDPRQSDVWGNIDAKKSELDTQSYKSYISRRGDHRRRWSDTAIELPSGVETNQQRLHHKSESVNDRQSFDHFRWLAYAEMERDEVRPSLNNTGSFHVGIEGKMDCASFQPFNFQSMAHLRKHVDTDVHMPKEGWMKWNPWHTLRKSASLQDLSSEELTVLRNPFEAFKAPVQRGPSHYGQNFASSL